MARLGEHGTGKFREPADKNVEATARPAAATGRSPAPLRRGVAATHGMALFTHTPQFKHSRFKGVISPLLFPSF